MNNEQCFTKITNKDMEQLIVCSINAKESNFLPTAYERSWLESLKYKELEIEGYVREDHFRDATKMAGEWMKFDPCKEDTYPPKGKFLAWGLPDPDGYGAQTEFICWRDDDGFSCHESADPEVLYWQLLPNPPVEKARSENESK